MTLDEAAKKYHIGHKSKFTVEGIATWANLARWHLQCAWRKIIFRIEGWRWSRGRPIPVMFLDPDPMLAAATKDAVEAATLELDSATANVDCCNRDLRQAAVKGRA